MICYACRAGADAIAASMTHEMHWVLLGARHLHSQCKGKTTCDCQHDVDAQAAGKSVVR